MAQVICDFKRGVPKKSDRLQTAAYELLAEAPDASVPDFDEAKHTYMSGSGRLPSVTEIISTFYPFKGIKDRFYTDRGTAVHQTLQYYDEGALDETSLCDETRGTLNCYLAFLKMYNPRPVLTGIEKRIASNVLGFAGTIDRIFDFPQIARPARLLLYIKPNHAPNPVWLPSNSDDDSDLKAFMGLLVNYHWSKK